MNKGDNFAGYTIKEQCGEGAFGTVYLAEDMLGRTLALKIFHTVKAGEKELAALKKYMQLPAVPALLQIMHSGMENGCLFYVMQAADNAGTPDHYIPDTLDYRLRQMGRFPIDAALNNCRHLLAATQILHQAGMVHRDIKPSNIIYVNGQLKLADLGLLADYSKTLSLAGSLGFIPPEIVNGGKAKSTTADIYAIGMTLYCMATGNAPEEFPAMPEDMPFESMSVLCKPLMHFCAKDPAMRISTCEDGLRELEQSRLRGSWLQRLGTRLRFQPHFRRVFIISLLVLMLLSGVAGAGAYRFYLNWQRSQQVYEESLTARAKRLSECGKYLHLQMPDITLKYDLQEIGEAISSRKLALAEAKLEALEQSLSAQAEAMVPLLDSASKQASFEQVSELFGFLSSPMYRFLDKERQRKLRSLANAEAKRLQPNDQSPCLGCTFYPYPSFNMKWAFIPAGKCVSQVFAGQIIDLKRPFWIMQTPLTNAQYNLCSKDRRKETASPAEKIIGLCWNDILTCCSNLNAQMQKEGVFPPGYAVRVPTAAEWEYVMLNGWFDGTLTERIPEFTPSQFEACTWSESSSPAEWQKDNLPVMRMVKNKIMSSATAKDNQFCTQTGYRLVIAPTDAHYYEQFFMHPKWKICRYKGKVYASILASYTQTKVGELRRYAAMLNAHLPEPESFEEWKEIMALIHEPDDFPVYTDIIRQGEHWVYRSTGKAVQIKELSAPKDKMNNISGSNRSFYQLMDDRMVPVYLLVWDSEEQFQSRSRSFAEALAQNGIVQLSCQGETLHLLPMIVTGCMAESFASLAEYHCAVLDTEGKFAEVAAKLKDYDGIVALGGTYRNEQFTWRNGERVADAQKIVRSKTDLVLISENVDILVLENGELCHSSNATAILLER